MSAKVKQVGYSDPTIAPGWRYWCLGCDGWHVLPTDARGQTNGHKWQFNGDLERPTFTPSVHLVGRCHSFVTDGRIQYLADCTHALAGQTVDMVPIDAAFDAQHWD